MNIFFLDFDPAKCAEYHYDRHVGKGLLELVQMLCTNASLQGQQVPYKPTHVNHPCTKWLRESQQNYEWGRQLAKRLGQEFYRRFGKNHKSYLVLQQMDKISYPNKGLTPPPYVMPEEYIRADLVDSYRDYYLHGKANLMKYTKRDLPDWVNKWMSKL